MTSDVHRLFAEPQIAVEEMADGSRILRSTTPLKPPEATLGAMLRRWAAAAPDRVLLADRDVTDTWRELTFAQAAGSAARVGQALLDRGLGPDRPLAILSQNSLDHAVLMLAGLLVGVPVVPISVAYSQLSTDFAKLRTIVDLVRPGLLYAEDGDAFADALASVADGRAEVVVNRGGPAGATRWDDLLATGPTPAVEAAAARVGPDTVAKVLFTSGSTGHPKGVVSTHRMLCANQQQLLQVWPFLAETPPVLVDWLPWNHTFGGCHDFHMVLNHGGTMYLDAGRPVPGLIEQTVRNLAEVSPTIALNVPAGFAAMLPYLERDAGLARGFFARLQLIFYAAAALPQDLWRRLEELSRATVGEVVPMTSSWGATETGPLATSAHFLLQRAGNLGVPVPGCEVKVVPRGAKLELRVRGPNVFPGYLGRPDLTAAAFDADGFYRSGDAARFAEPDDPAAGLIFDGRLAEDFKLTSGTWVPVGAIRVEAIAAASPLIQDAVVAGADRDRAALLVWLNATEAARVAALPADDLGAIAASEAVRAALRAGLAAYNARQRGSSTRLAVALVMREPPSIDAGEITDKGYVNQRATLDRRADLVERLYARPPDPEVLLL